MFIYHFLKWLWLLLLLLLLLLMSRRLLRGLLLTGLCLLRCCCSYSSNHQYLAVGEVNGNMVRIYSTNAGMDLVKEITLTGATMDVAYSPDQKYLVTADSNRKVGPMHIVAFSIQSFNYSGDPVLSWGRV